MTKQKLAKHTMNLREGDMARLQEQFPEIGASVVIRRIVSNYIDRHLDGRTPQEDLDRIDIQIQEFMSYGDPGIDGEGSSGDEQQGS